MKSFFGSCILAISLLCTLPPASIQAEVLDFGGVAEKFKGGGDKEPPQCQVNIPRAADEPFFIKWNCEDNWADSNNITSELWLYRKNSEVGVKVASFLGFPASVLVDENLLQVENFTDGLPVGFRLVATDRAGVSTLTGLLVVTSQDLTINNCDLYMESEATEADGGTTGEPAKSVTTTNTSVTSTPLSSSSVQVSTSEKDEASPCEISSVCEDDNSINFTASLDVDSLNDVSGTISITPGSVTATVTGDAVVKDNAVDSFDVSGSTTIEGVETTIRLQCEK